MRGNLVDRRAVLKTMSAAAAIGAVAARLQPAAAQQVKWSAGTEAPKLRAPAGAADCHQDAISDTLVGGPVEEEVEQDRVVRSEGKTPKCSTGFRRVLKN